jgi:DNA-binding beta-propeller fold protein YncE
MVPTAYADAKLERVPRIEDTLTIIGLPLNSKQPVVSPIQVSNSVMSWSQIMAVSPDGRWAYVAEVRSRPTDGIQEFKTIDEMAEGERVTVVDISHPTQPKAIESVNVGRNPEPISISPDGKLLAVNLEDAGRELLIVQLQPDGKLGKRFYFPISSSPQQADNGAAIWHPSGKFLAMTQDQNRRVGFYAVQTMSNGDIKVQPLCHHWKPTIISVILDSHRIVVFS